MLEALDGNDLNYLTGLDTSDLEKQLRKGEEVRFMNGCTEEEKRDYNLMRRTEGTNQRTLDGRPIECASPAISCRPLS